MLGGGLLPGTLTVVYGATGIGKTHLGLIFAERGRLPDGARGLVVDMNARGDSQQHGPYAGRLFGWDMERWTHTVMPMTDPYPSAADLAAHYLDVFPWTGRRSDYETDTPGGRELDWAWKAAYARALYTARPFFYFHFAHGSRRVVFDGIEPWHAEDSIQGHVIDQLYRTVILPAIFPELRATILLSLGTGWAAVLGAEYLGAQSGLGYIIVYSQQFAYLDRMFFVALLFVVYASISYAAFNALSQRLLRWAPRAGQDVVVG